MGQLLVRSPYNGETSSTPTLKHAICQMANGKAALLVSDTNVNSGASDSRLYIYVANAARTSVVAVANWAWTNLDPDTQQNLEKASVAIDASGNLHVVYVWYEGAARNESVRYRKLTYNSGTDTFTLGAEAIVSAFVTNRFVAQVDIDTVAQNTDCPIIAASFRTGTTSFTTTVVAFNRQTGGTWVSNQFLSIAGDFRTADVCISARDSVEVATNFQFLLSWNAGPLTTGADPGDNLWLGRAVVGGAFVGGSNIAIIAGGHKNYNGGYRAWDIFWIGPDTFFVHVLVRSDPHLSWYTVITTSPTSNAWSYAIQPKAIAFPDSRFYRYVRRFSSASNIKSTVPNEGAIATFNVQGNNVWIGSFEYALVAGTWRVTSKLSRVVFNTGYEQPSNALVPQAGERGRFSTPDYVDVMVPYSYNTPSQPVRKVYLYRRAVKPTVTITAPAENGTVLSNTPDISVQVTGVGSDATNIRSRVEVQVSTSNSFTTSVQTIRQPVSAEAYYSTTATAVKVSLLNYPLSQGVWYVRVRSVDQFGGVGSWSPTRKFTITHPPTAVNLSPDDGAVVVYDPAGVAFDWQFKDPYALDVQTAYDIDVIDTVTQALVVSSGKVPTGDTQGTVVIPGSSIDKELDWYITVWDGDDSSSDQVSGGTFFLTQRPAPTVTFPAADGDDVNTATPTITWNTGISAGKSQYSYRLQLRDSANKLLYDTRTVLSSSTSAVLPAGLLRNGLTYKVTIFVTDNTMLDASSSRIFDVAWTPPITLPRPEVYLDYYDLFGFASVIASTAGRDDDIVQFNLYRRKMEESSPWELIYEISTLDSFIVLRDYHLPAGVTSEYAVTQLVDRFGDQIESSLALAPRIQINPQGAHYWLIDDTDLDSSMRVNNVVTESYTPETEEVSYVVVGKGRQVETGENAGITGTIGARLRDINSGGFYAENYNFLKNPNFESDQLGTPDQWTFGNTGQAATSSVDDYALLPGPGNRRSGRLQLTSQRTGVGSGQSFTRLEQIVNKSSYFQMLSGGTYYVSVWTEISSPVANYSVQITAEWREGSTVRGTQVVAVDTDTATVLPGDVAEVRVVNGTLWYRIGRVITVPGGFPGLDNLRVQIGIISDTGTSAYPNVRASLEAATLTLGPNPVQYFSGEEPSGEWVGVARQDISYTVGSYTARKQRQLLINLQSQGHSLQLRNPFGDVFPVHVSNMSIDRVAGVGPSEFVDVEIPYLQLREEVD